MYNTLNETIKEVFNQHYPESLKDPEIMKDDILDMDSINGNKAINVDRNLNELMGKIIGSHYPALSPRKENKEREP
jgi:hypothetical protein